MLFLCSRFHFGFNFLFLYISSKKIYLFFSLEEMVHMADPVLNTFETKNEGESFPFLKRIIFFNPICHSILYLLIHLVFTIYQRLCCIKNVINYNKTYTSLMFLYTMFVVGLITTETNFYTFLSLHGIYLFGGTEVEVLIHNYILVLLVSFLMISILVTLLLILVSLELIVKVFFTFLNDIGLLIFCYGFDYLFFGVFVCMYSYKGLEYYPQLRTFFLEEFRFFGYFSKSFSMKLPLIKK